MALNSDSKKLVNNARPGGEGEIIAIMKRKMEIIDYDPIQMITGAGLVFMMINQMVGLPNSILKGVGLVMS